MVIWTHSGNADLFFPELGQDAPWWHFQYPVMQEILRVDIPCFIMLSAYLFYRNFTMKRLGEKLNKRLHSLLVPVPALEYYLLRGVCGGEPDSGTADDRQPDGSGDHDVRGMAGDHQVYLQSGVLVHVSDHSAGAAGTGAVSVSEKYLDRRGISAGAACGTFQRVALPELNLDALIYYSFAAYAALHGRKWAEAVWSWKRAALGCACWQWESCSAGAYYTHYFVPGIVLYQLLAVIGIWMMVNERWLGEVRPFMTCTFYLCDALCGIRFPQ